MAGIYGESFASKLITAGKYEEAIAEATRAISQEESNPESWFERATANAWLERYTAAVLDFERALELDVAEGILETDAVDDAYFSALLGEAKAVGADRLTRYAEVLPKGRHLKDALDWARRLRGELKSEFVKARLEP